MSEPSKRKRGRPAGALNAMLMNSTRIYQEQVTPEDLAYAYSFVVSVMKDTNEDTKLRMEALDRFMKWGAYTPQVVATADLTQELAESAQPSAEAMAQAARLIESLSKS